MNAQVNGQLHAIGRRYIARTLKEMEELRKDIEGVKAGQEESLPNVAHAAHRISGSAAMFGFNDVSECASRIGQLVAAIEANQHPEEEFSALDTIAIELDLAVRRAARARGVR